MSGKSPPIEEQNNLTVIAKCLFHRGLQRPAKSTAAATIAKLIS
jgi:hypothetical protein